MGTTNPIRRFDATHERTPGHGALPNVHPRNYALLLIMAHDVNRNSDNHQLVTVYRTFPPLGVRVPALAWGALASAIFAAPILVVPEFAFELYHKKSMRGNVLATALPGPVYVVVDGEACPVTKRKLAHYGGRCCPLFPHPA
jgi:hypothetical protein